MAVQGVRPSQTAAPSLRRLCYRAVCCEQTGVLRLCNRSPSSRSGRCWRLRARGWDERLRLVGHKPCGPRAPMPVLNLDGAGLPILGGANVWVYEGSRAMGQLENTMERKRRPSSCSGRSEAEVVPHLRSCRPAVRISGRHNSTMCNVTTRTRKANLPASEAARHVPHSRPALAVRFW